MTSINLLQTVLPIEWKIYTKYVTKILQTIQLDYKLLKNIDIFSKIGKIIISKIITIGKKGEIKMKNQNGKSPLGWIIAIAVGVIIVGVAVAMIFG